MRIGYRGKLFIVSISLVLGAVLIAGGYLASRLRSYLEARIEKEMIHHAQVVASILEQRGTVVTIEGADRLADSLGGASAMRVTIIHEDGRVLGDSELSVSEVRAVENHGTRPEVLAAQDHDWGISRRFSITLGHQMLYVAAPYQTKNTRGTVRFAMSLQEVDEAIAALRLVLLIAALIGLLVAVVAAGLTSHRFSKTLRELYSYARRLSEEGRGGHLHMLDSRDEIGGLTGSLSQLSEQLEEQVDMLAAERDRFQAVLNGMEEAVLAIDDNGRITLINRAGVLLLGLSEQPIGKTILETIRSPELYSILQESGGPSGPTAEFELPGRPGCLVLATASRSKSFGTILVLRDVTDTRKLESMRRDFVANVSHELRTPVSVMRANAETLLNGALEDPDARIPFVESIERNARRLAHLIDDLLDISRIEAGKWNMALQEVSVQHALEHAVDALGDGASTKKISLTMAPIDNDSTLVIADPRALDQVLYNFLDNAIKYTQERGAIVLRARSVDHQVQLEVEDNGPGIAEPHRDRLFERFYRVDTGRSREMGGTGLGLSIVKHLTGAMDAEVGMTSATPQGSLFWIRLPRPL